MEWIHQVMPHTAITPERNAAQRYQNWSTAIHWDHEELIRQYRIHALALREALMINWATVQNVLVTARMIRREIISRGLAVPCI